MGLFSKKKSTSSPTQNGQNSSPLSPLDMVINTINKQRAKSRIKPISRDDIEHLDFTIKPPLYRSHQDAISEGVAHGLRRNVGAQQEPELMLAEILMHTARTGGSKGKVLSLTPDRGVVSRFVRGNCNFFQIDTSSDPQRFITAARLILDHGSDLVTAKKITGGTLMKAVEQLFDNNEQECFYLNGDIPASMVSPMKSPPQNGSHTKSDPEESQPGPSGLTRSRGRTANQAAASKSAKSITGATTCPLKAPYLELVPLRYALVESKERLKGNFFKHRYRFKEKQLGIRDARNGYIYQLHSDYPNQMREYTLKDGKLSLQKEVVKTGEAAVDYPAIKPYSEFKSEHILVPKGGCVYIAFSEVKWTEQRIQDFLASDDTNKSKMMQTVGIPAHPKMMGGSLDLLPPYQLDQAVSECMAPPAQKTQTTPSDETQQKEKEEPWCWVDGHYHGKGSPFNPMSVDDFKGRIEPSEMQDNAMFILLNDEAGMIRDLASLQDTVQSKIQALLEDVKYQDGLNIQAFYQASTSGLADKFATELRDVAAAKRQTCANLMQDYLQAQMGIAGDIPFWEKLLPFTGDDATFISNLSKKSKLAEQLKGELGDDWPKIQEKLDSQAKAYVDSRDGTALAKGVREVTQFDEMKSYLHSHQKKHQQWLKDMADSIDDMHQLALRFPLTTWQYDFDQPDAQKVYSELTSSLLRHMSRSEQGQDHLYQMFFSELNSNTLIYMPMQWQSTANYANLTSNFWGNFKNVLDKGYDLSEKLNDHALALKKVLEQTSDAIAQYAEFKGNAAYLQNLTRVYMLPGFEKLLTNLGDIDAPGATSYQRLFNFNPVKLYVTTLSHEGKTSFWILPKEHQQLADKIEGLNETSVNLKQKLTQAEETLSEKRSHLLQSKNQTGENLKAEKKVVRDLKKYLRNLNNKIDECYDAMRGLWQNSDPEQKKIFERAMSNEQLATQHATFTGTAVAAASTQSRDGTLLQKLKASKIRNIGFTALFAVLDGAALYSAAKDFDKKGKSKFDSRMNLANAFFGFSGSVAALSRLYLDPHFEELISIEKNDLTKSQARTFMLGAAAIWGASLFSFGAAATALVKDGKTSWQACSAGDDPLFYAATATTAADLALSALWGRVTLRGITVLFSEGFAASASGMLALLATGPIALGILFASIAQIGFQLWQGREKLSPAMNWINHSAWGDQSKGHTLIESRKALLSALHQPLMSIQNEQLALYLPGVGLDALKHIELGATRDQVVLVNNQTRTTNTAAAHHYSSDELLTDTATRCDESGTTLSWPLAMFGDSLKNPTEGKIPVVIELQAKNGVLDPDTTETTQTLYWNVDILGSMQSGYGYENPNAVRYSATITPTQKAKALTHIYNLEEVSA